jgi:hypothetical protein
MQWMPVYYTGLNIVAVGLYVVILILVLTWPSCRSKILLLLAVFFQLIGALMWQSLYAVRTVSDWLGIQGEWLFHVTRVVQVVLPIPRLLALVLLVIFVLSMKSELERKFRTEQL